MTARHRSRERGESIPVLDRVREPLAAPDRVDTRGLVPRAVDALVEVGQSDRTLREVRMTTGILDVDGRFAPHGHIVRLRVRGT